MCPEQPAELLKQININETRELWEEEAIKKLDKEIKKLSDKDLDTIIDLIGKTNVRKVAQKPKNQDEPDELTDITLSDTIWDFEQRIARSLTYEKWLQEQVDQGDIMCIVKDLTKILRRNRFKHESWQIETEEYPSKNDEVMLLQVYINAINERQGKTPLSPTSMERKRLKVDGVFWSHTLNGLLMAVGWEMAAQGIFLDFWAWQNGKRQPWTKWIIKNGMRYMPVDIDYKQGDVAYDWIQADLTNSNSLEKIRKIIWQDTVDEIKGTKLLCCILNANDEKKETVALNFDGIKQVLMLSAKLLKKWKKAYFLSGSDLFPADFEMINGVIKKESWRNGEKQDIDTRKKWEGKDFEEIFEGIKFEDSVKPGWAWLLPCKEDRGTINDRFRDKFRKIAEEVSKECWVVCTYTSDKEEKNRFPPATSFEITK